MKNIVDRKLKNELNDLYEKATKSDTLNLYAVLKKELENLLISKNIDNDLCHLIFLIGIL